MQSDSFLVGATVAQTAGAIAEGEAQSAAYKQQAAVADQNAAIQNIKTSQAADKYAKQARRISDEYKLQSGARAAAMGAAGLNSGVGTGLDLASSEFKAYQDDMMTNLQNQRNDTWSSYLQETNYTNAAKQYRANAKTAKRMGYMNALGTALGGAASIYGQKGKNAPTTPSTGG